MPHASSQGAAHGGPEPPASSGAIEARAAASLLAAFLESTQDLVVMKDRALRTTMCNATFARALGKEPRDVVGKTDVENGWDPELVHGNPAKGIRGFEQDDRDALAGRAVHNPYDPANVGGEVRIFDTQKLPVRDAAGNVEWVLGISRDITDRARVEAALRASEAQFRKIIDVSPVPYALNDEHGNITYLNPAFVRTFGYERADIPTLADWWPRAYPDPRYREEVATGWGARLDEARRTGVLVPQEVTICCKDGTRRTALISASPLGDGFAGLHLVILYDITERKRVEEERRGLEERARNAQKLESLGILAGGVAHDVNNMLQGILGHAELALGQLPPGAPARRALDEVVTSARSCAGLTTQLLAYAGKGRFVVEDVSLARLVEDMRGLLLASVPKKATLELDLPADVPAVAADPSQLRQVVLNLVVNAGEAIGDRPGHIRVAVSGQRCAARCPCRELFPAADERSDRDVVSLVVTDTGDGMDEATRGRIFEPFFSTKFAGRGLGLAAVHGILRRHGAGARVESAPGRGTTFTVHFPAVAGARERRPAPAGPPAAEWRGRGTVVFADDEPAIRRFGRVALEGLGFTVVAACDGAEAIELCVRHRAELVCVVLDLAMPKLDGVETLASLRKLGVDVPVLLTSGYSQETFDARIADRGAWAFIHKPYALDKLVTTLRGLLGA